MWTARTSNSKEPQQKYRLGTVSIKILGGGGGLNRFYGIPTSPSASIMAQNIQLFGPREGFLTHQWIITGNKLITDKYYDEAKMRVQQERVATMQPTPGDPGCRTTPLEHWSKTKPTVEQFKQDSRKSMYFILLVVWLNQSKVNCISFRLSPAFALYNSKTWHDAEYFWIISSTIFELDRRH